MFVEVFISNNYSVRLRVYPEAALLSYRLSDKMSVKNVIHDVSIKCLNKMSYKDVTIKCLTWLSL